MMARTSLQWLIFLTSLLRSTPNQDPEELTAKAGEDVTLQCRDHRGGDIGKLVWSRTDLGSDGYVFFFRENRLYEYLQHHAYCGRVTLRDPEMKDGDVSVVLKNVSVNDNGTYQCRVANGEGDKLINTTKLTVSGSNSENKMNDVPEDGNSSPVGRGLAAGVTVVMLLVAVFAVVGFLMYKRHKNKRSGPPAAADDACAERDGIHSSEWCVRSCVNL
ncbi:nectin-4-like [Perca fluviatilis]|uniref:nectin-4-like n=1 Tax=Perca fluviatilis TaxID=8168 RepID=UPI001963DFC3|nr:nectin-4-like [Perca fluviatilis]